MLKELASFQAAFACSEDGPSRVLGSNFLMQLINLSFGKGEKFPYVVIGCIKAQLSTSNLVDGVCKLLGPRELTRLVSKSVHDSIVKAEGLMVSARKLCIASGA